MTGEGPEVPRAGRASLLSAAPQRHDRAPSLARTWEIRGLFGNEFALEGAVGDLEKQRRGALAFETVTLDRRNLSVRLQRRDEELEGIIRRTLEIHHGFVESEGPLGEYDKQREAVRRKKLRDYEKKKQAQHGTQKT